MLSSVVFSSVEGTGVVSLVSMPSVVSSGLPVVSVFAGTDVEDGCISVTSVVVVSNISASFSVVVSFFWGCSVVSG